MNFNTHSNLRGLHAPFSASGYHWINYDEKKFIEVYKNLQAKEEGTELHDIARKLIEHRIKLPNNKKTFNSYVNDAIGFRMVPEQILYFSDNFFGTADAISFDEKKHFLRIHDLKTGRTPASMNQLFIYASLFCLEYGIKPSQIDAELRIYQNDDILVCNPAVEDIEPIMEKIILFDDLINKANGEY